MAPTTALARPPFAVDDADTTYVDRKAPPPQSRTREERNKISESQYTAYDSYFDSKDDRSRQNPNNNNSLLAAPSSGHRPSPSADSAIDAIGDGFLAALAGDSDSDSDDDRPQPSPTRKPVSPTSPMQPKSKNQALFEAAVADDRANSPLPPPAYEDTERRTGRPAEKEKGGRQPPSQANRGPSPNLHPQQHQQYSRGPSPAPSVTPPPPAAPLQVHIPNHQMNAPQPKRIIQPGGPEQGYGGPGQLSIVPPSPGAFNGPSAGFQPPSPMYGNGPMPGSAGFHMHPTPIPSQTSTPIQPVFIRPIKPAFLKSESDEGNEKASIMSHESSMPIMRGDKEDYLPLRSGPRIPRVGEKAGGAAGDDFWRRFSMVVKTDRALPAHQKKSEWLKSNTRGGKAYIRWVWCIGFFAIILIAGASVAGWWFTRDNADHQVPVAIGGGAEETMTNAGSTVDPTPVGAATATATTSHKKAAATATSAADATTKKKKRSSKRAEVVTEDADTKHRRGDAARSHRRRRNHLSGLGSAA